MGEKLWGDLDLEQQIKNYKKENKSLEETNERLLEENENLRIIISKFKDKAFNQ